LFLRNLLLNESHPLHNRTLHISGTFKAPEKANIDTQKANIEKEKVNIENSFTVKTASHICRLLDEYGFQKIFGRSDVQDTLGLKPTRSTALLKELAEKGFVEPVSGLGKGKYRFILKKDRGI
jgi:Fic family protein